MPRRQTAEARARFQAGSWAVAAHAGFGGQRLSAPGSSTSRPRVSLVTISFNQADYVERTIRSVLAQDYANLEYIVVDPGSTDGSRDIIERYRQQIDKIIFRPDRGAADGLNGGFAEATGEILGFLNSDDLLMPGAVSAAVDYLQQHPGVDIVNGHSTLIDPDDKFLRRLFSDRMSVRRFLYGGVVLMQPSSFFRRGIFERVGGFNVNNRVIWDGELFLDMALAGGRFAVTNQVWSAYRIHRQSISGTLANTERIRKTNDAMFLRVMRREPNRMDRILGVGYRLLRHLTNPVDTWERLRRGPVFGRRLEN